MFNRSRIAAFTVIAAVGAGGLLAAAAFIQQDGNGAAQAQPKGEVQQRAIDIAAAAQKHLAGARTVAVDVAHTTKASGGFLLVQEEQKSEHKLAYEQPNRFSFEPAQELAGETIVSTGKKLYTYIPMVHRYVEHDAPSAVNAMLDEVVVASVNAQMGNPGPLMFTIPLMQLDFAKAATDGTIREAIYKGEETIDGRAAHRVQFVLTPPLPKSMTDEMAAEVGENVRMNFRFDALIDADAGNPLVRRIEYDLKKMMLEMMAQTGEEMLEMMRDVQMEMAVNFNNWRINDELPEGTFAFARPSGAKKAASFEEALMPGGSHPLVGRPAPDFELTMFDSSQMNLSQHKGKDVVVLDFWATWCTPCIMAMPDLIEATNEFADRGVVFYAVNTQETNEQVKSMLERQKWQIKVPMDTEGAVSRRYFVSGIPQTVIIGRDGTVEAVHVGAAPKSQLQRELRTLVEGGTLIESDDDNDEDTPGGG